MYQRKRSHGLMFMASMLSTSVASAPQPVQEWAEPNQLKKPGYENQKVVFTKSKEGYTCKVFGVINFLSQNWKIKAYADWMRAADQWFQNTPIDQVISKTFVTVITIP